MNNLKRILVATDFSDHSKFAIARAIEIAKIAKAQLTIIYIARKGLLEKVVEEVVPAIGAVLLKPEEYAAALLKKQLVKLEKSNIKTNYVIFSGNNPAVKILKYAKNNKYDLLVMGSHGKYSINDWFVGTTAEYVAKKTTIPVLIVKKAANKPYKNILIATDFSISSKNALEFANRVFSKATMNILHVGDHEYEEFLKEKHTISKGKIKEIQEAILFSLREKAKNFIKKSNIKLKSYSFDIKLGYPGVVIVDEAKKLKQDLIIMGTQGQSRQHPLLLGKVASLVLIEIDRDILLVPAKK